MQRIFPESARRVLTAASGSTAWRQFALGGLLAGSFLLGGCAEAPEEPTDPPSEVEERSEPTPRAPGASGTR